MSWSPYASRESRRPLAKELPIAPMLAISRSQPRGWNDLEVDGGDHGVDEEEQHEGDDHRLVDGATDAARAATGVETLVGTDDGRHPAEDHGLDDRDVEVGDAGERGERRQERARRAALDDDREEVAAADPGADHDPDDHEGHEHGGQHARDHEPRDRVDAE